MQVPVREQVETKAERPAVIQVARPWMDEREADAARRAILSGWITQGPEVAAFEREFAAQVGAAHACAVSNCTTALHLALLAAGVRPGDEVITVSHSFIATANSIRYCGAMPVFVDIEPGTFNIDPRIMVESAIDAAHAGDPVRAPDGHAVRPGRLVLESPRATACLLIEDAACAIGSEICLERAVGADRQAARRRRLLLVPPAQSDHHRRRRHAHHRESRVGPTVPALAPARHERAGHGAARSREVIFESYPVTRLQLPDDRHPGGRRARAAEAAAGDRGAPAGAGGALRRLLSGIPGLVAAGRAAVGAQQLAELLRAPARHCDQRRVMQPMLDRGICHAARHHVRASRARLCGGAVALHARSARERARAGPFRSSFRCSSQMSDAEQQTVAAALRESVEEEHAG